MPAQFSRTTRSLASDSGARALVVWAVIAALLVCWLGWFFFGRVTVYEVSAKARLEVRQAAHPVSAWLPSRIVKNSLSIGTAVRAGEVLVELDASSETLLLREEEARRKAIAPQIDALQREIAAHERAGAHDRQAALAAAQAGRSRLTEAAAGVAFADDNERRLNEESTAGSVARIEALRALADSRRLTAAKDALAADLRHLGADTQTREQQHRALVESLKRTLASLQGQMATASATIARLEADIDKHRIRAPIDGRIGDVVPLRAGEYVSAGQKLATVIPSGELIIVADFNPVAVLGRVRPGQTARLRLDGFPWAQYGSITATVTRVASEIRDNLVRVEFTPKSSFPPGIAIQHGLPGAVEVSVEQVAPVVLVVRASGQMLSGAAATASP